MAKEAVYIEAHFQGNFMGYVKTISETRDYFAVTPSKIGARSFKTFDAVTSAIEKLAKMPSSAGYVFTIG